MAQFSKQKIDWIVDKFGEKSASLTIAGAKYEGADSLRRLFESSQIPDDLIKDPPGTNPFLDATPS